MCRVRQGQCNRRHGITRARVAAAGATPAATTETTDHAATTTRQDPEDRHTVDPTVGEATRRRRTTTAPPVVTTEAPDLTAPDRMAVPGALTAAQEDTAVEVVTAVGVIARNS